MSIAIRLNYISLIEILRTITTVEITEQVTRDETVTTPHHSHYEPEKMDEHERYGVDSDEEHEAGDILGKSKTPTIFSRYFIIHFLFVCL